MDKVGGYSSLRELEQDARAYEDVLIWLEAEADAATIARLKEASGG